MESKTPICDKHKYETDQGAEVVPLHVAIELECKLHEREREVGEVNAKWLKLNDQLAEAQSTAMEIGEQKQILNKMIDHNERELTDKDRQLADARAENWRLQTQCEIIKDIERHRVHQWYHGKLAALYAWAKKQPDDVSKPIFACLACGSPSVYESPEHSQMLNGLQHALEKSEKHLNKVRAEIESKNRLIEQMRDALKGASKHFDQNYWNVKNDPDFEDLNEIWSNIEAALRQKGANDETNQHAESGR